jgi:hypothetical protein
LPKARPISCNDSPAFQRRQISVFCAEERPYRLPLLINTTSKTTDLCQMVLHPPVELAPFCRNFSRTALLPTNWPRMYGPPFDRKKNSVIG